MKLKIVKAKAKIDNDWSVKRVAKEYTPITWEKVFESSKYEIEDVSDILSEDEGKRIPDNKNLFKAFDLTPIYNVKVVIFGQYPNCYINNPEDKDTGLAYSISKNTGLTSSLETIYKELKNSIPGFVIPTHGDLTKWCLQGVLLLNSCLTVRESYPGSHKEIWMGFMKKIINAILDLNPHCIFVLWGKNVQKMKKIIGERTTILESSHPSFSKAFLGCNHFNIINDLLVKQGKEIINWNLI